MPWTAWRWPRDAGAHAFAHITGGGLAGNLARVLPDGVTRDVDRSTWSPQPVFDLIARTGAVARDQLELTFNLGVGMVAVVPADRATDALALRRAGMWPPGRRASRARLHPRDGKVT